MRKFIALIVAVAACGCLLTGCNEKPRNYRFVKVMNDGKEEMQEITAKNDTDALKQYLSAMEKVILENMEKPDAERNNYKAMYIISPDGDTLNTNNELLEAAMKGQEGSTIIQPGTAPKPAAPSGPKMTPLKRQALPQGQPAAPAR